MFAADSHLEFGARAASALHADPHQPANALFVYRHKGVVLQNAALDVIGQKLAGVVAGERIAGLRQIVGAEGEEIRVQGELVCGQRGARHLDHGADAGAHPDAGVRGQHCGKLALHQRAQPFQLAHMGNQRQHNLRLHFHAAHFHRAGGLRNGAHLHGVDFGKAQAQAAAAVAEHGVELAQLVHLGAQRGGGGAQGGGHGANVLICVGQKLVHGGIEQADGDRQPGHGGEDSLKVALLHRQQLGQRALAGFGVRREDHLAHGENLPRLEEHMLGAAEADALCAELPGQLCVRGAVGVGAHAHAANAVRPAHQFAEGAAEFGQHRRHLPRHHLAAAAVQRDEVARAEHPRAHAHFAGGVVHAQRAAARHAALAHAARHHRGVRGHAAARGEDSLGGVHAVNVLGRSLNAHQNHLLARPRLRLGIVGRKHNAPHRRTRRGRQPLRHHIPHGGGIQRGMQQLVERFGVHPRHRLAPVNQPFLRHIHGNFHRRIGGALAVARLQHPELAALNGELHVLHIAVVLFEPLVNAHQFAVGAGHALFQRGQIAAGFAAAGAVYRQRRANAGHHIFALRVHHVFAVEALVAA